MCRSSISVIHLEDARSIEPVPPQLTPPHARHRKTCYFYTGLIRLSVPNCSRTWSKLLSLENSMDYTRFPETGTTGHPKI
jgi:hypothetical protein